jgi:lysophospholipase L1-like esterase
MMNRGFAALVAALVLVGGGITSAHAIPTGVGGPLPGSAATTTPTTVTSPTLPVGRDILIMGSSTTGCTGPAEPAQCYVNLVQAAHPADRFTVLARGGTYVAYGPASGNWTQTVIPTGQEVVIVQLGINDWYVPVDAATYRTQVDELLGRIRTANPTASILWLAAWMPAYAPYSEARQQMWQDHGVAVAGAINAVGGAVLDMHPTGDRRAAAEYRADENSGWHYNAKGHRKMADALLVPLAA